MPLQAAWILAYRAGAMMCLRIMIKMGGLRNEF